MKDFSVLIADDEAHIRTFLKLILMDIGVTKVHQVHNGMDAVDAYKEYKPDLAILDINMNVMNGLDALGHIREFDADAPVVMMSAVSTRSSVVDSSKKGALYYIIKTQAPDIIKEELQKVIGSLTSVA